MSCNCNNASRTCDPCAFCTPPGVTGLTTCKVPDPCEGEPIDITCVTYSGIDFDCINVANGDTLIDVLLNILATYFPPQVCCELEGTISTFTTTTSTTLPPTTTTSTTTSTTTTSTSTTSTSTTTTTTINPESCQCYGIVNNTYQRRTYSYVNCNTKLLEFGFVPPRVESGPPVIAYQCALSISADPQLTVLPPFGLCSQISCPPDATTTTTTQPPISTCLLYTIQYYNLPDPVVEEATGFYVDCFGETILWTLSPFNEISFCAQEGSIVIIVGDEFLILGDSGPCIP